MPKRYMASMVPLELFNSRLPLHVRRLTEDEQIQLECGDMHIYGVIRRHENEEFDILRTLGKRVEKVIRFDDLTDDRILEYGDEIVVPCPSGGYQLFVYSVDDAK